ncbi:MAG: helix-turn-helix domain-containing protein [Pseudomonadota bacterium]
MIVKPLCIAVSGGKGGTGKSTFARNLAVFFAQLGNRTALLDFSSSFSTMSSLSGMKQWSLDRREGIYQQKTALEKFVVLHAPGAEHLLAGVYHFEREEKRFDVIICDMPPTVSSQLVDIFPACEIPLVVTSPEPESIFETFEFLSRLIFALIERESRGRWSFDDLSLAAAPGSRISFFLSPHDVLLAGIDDELGAFLRKILDELLVGLVVNGARSSAELELGPDIENFGRKVFSLPLVYAGAVEFDPGAAEYAVSRKSLIAARPESKLALDVEKLGRRFISCPGIRLIRPSGKLGSEIEDNCYEVLQSSYASQAYEIKESYGKLRRLFSDKTMFFAGVARRDIIDKLASRCDEAFAIVGNEDRRTAYDQELAAEVKLDVEEAQEPDLDEEIDWMVKLSSGKGAERSVSGRFIRETREKMGLGFHDIASATKIGTQYLRAIEEENYVDLPEPVYVKGFLKEIARILNLDPDLVALSYLKRMKEGMRET